MPRNARVWSIAIAAVVGLSLPAAAVDLTPKDLDLSGLPEKIKVEKIAQDANGQPLRLCARWPPRGNKANARQALFVLDDDTTRRSLHR